MKKTYNIVWEKWRDPFCNEEESEDTVTDSQPNDEDMYTPYDDLKEDTNHMEAKNIKCKILITPMGVIPYNELTASSKIFNFWTGHSNFTLTDSIVSTIENTDGVETLDVFTRYRFRIGVGKAFSDSDVMRKINSRVYEILR